MTLSVLIGPNAFEEARAEVIMSLRRGSGNERRRRGGLKSQRLSTPRRLSGRQQEYQGLETQMAYVRVSRWVLSLML